MRENKLDLQPVSKPLEQILGVFPKVKKVCTKVWKTQQTDKLFCTPSWAQLCIKTKLNNGGEYA